MNAKDRIHGGDVNPSHYIYMFISYGLFPLFLFSQGHTHTHHLAPHTSTSGTQTSPYGNETSKQRHCTGTLARTGDFWAEWCARVRLVSLVFYYLPYRCECRKIVDICPDGADSDIHNLSPMNRCNNYTGVFSWISHYDIEKRASDEGLVNL